jgi:DNA-binding MarR family transcriptional regulator
MGQDALSELITIDRSNSGRALKRLEREGYVVRNKSEEDGRSKVVVITAKGREAAGGIARIRKQIAQSFFVDLTEEQATTVLNLLRSTVEGESQR